MNVRERSEALEYEFLSEFAAKSREARRKEPMEECPFRTKFQRDRDRILHSKRKRPLTENKTEAELAEYIRHHYAERLPFYEQARITVKSEDFDLENLIKCIEHEEKPAIINRCADGL